jgi:hypothetical protein
LSESHASADRSFIRINLVVEERRIHGIEDNFMEGELEPFGKHFEVPVGRPAIRVGVPLIEFVLEQRRKIPENEALEPV